MSDNGALLSGAAANVERARRKIDHIRSGVVDRIIPWHALATAYLELEMAQKVLDKLERERRRQMQRSNQPCADRFPLDTEGMRGPHIPDTDPEDWHRYLRRAVSHVTEGGMAWTCAVPGLPHPPSRRRAMISPGSCTPPRPECRALTHAKLDDIGVPRFDDNTESGWVPVGVYSPPVQPCGVCGRACVVTVDDRRVHPICAREASGLTA